MTRLKYHFEVSDGMLERRRNGQDVTLTGNRMPLLWSLRHKVCTDMSSACVDILNANKFNKVVYKCLPRLSTDDE